MIQNILLAIVIGLLSYLYYILRQRQNYWNDRNIPHIESPVWGHFFKTFILKENVTKALSRLYFHKNAQNQPFVGINVFHKPSILVRDPDLIKRILVKDFSVFVDRFTRAPDPEMDKSANNLFQVKNPLWKKLRSKLSPTFTSGKMKQMFYMVDKVGNDLHDVVKTRIESNSEFSIRTLMAMFTIDVISLVAFGTESNCLKDPQNSVFLKNAQKAFAVKLIDQIAIQSIFFLQGLMKVLRLTTFNPDFDKFLTNLFHEVTDHRIKSGTHRNDFIDALIDIKKNDNDEGQLKLTDDILIAQAGAFFFAGFETSSSTLEFAFYHIAKDEEIQNKIREEIRQGFEKHGKLTYEFVSNDMSFTTCVIRETLRLYPILPFIDRECLAQDGYDLKPYADFKVPPGMPVHIPITSIHRDPQYYPEPNKFDPDRFDPNLNTINEYTFMPFGLGPRNCIGERFAYMQMKVGIASLLKSFTVELADKSLTISELDPTNVLLHPKKEVVLKFKSNPV